MEHHIVARFGEDLDCRSAEIFQGGVGGVIDLRLATLFFLAAFFVLPAVFRVFGGRGIGVGGYAIGAAGFFLPIVIQDRFFFRKVISFLRIG